MGKQQPGLSVGFFRRRFSLQGVMMSGAKGELSTCDQGEALDTTPTEAQLRRELAAHQKKKPKKTVKSAPRLKKLPCSSQNKARVNWRDSELTSTVAPPPSSPAKGQLTATMYPALVLNADYTPLSYVPLSLWSWQDTLRAVLRDVAIDLSHYDAVVRSPSVEMRLPSVIVLKEYVQTVKQKQVPPCTRKNMFLRDKFCCCYCKKQFTMKELTFDHVVPRSRKGGSNWENLVTCCSRCNVKKGNRLLSQISDMSLSAPPHTPTYYELQKNAKLFPPKTIHKDWEYYI